MPTTSWGSSASSYGYGFCSGYSPLGFASTPFSGSSLFNALLPFGQSFYYRGQYYAYNAFGDCYTTQSPYYRFGGGYGGYVIAQAPPIYRPRTFDPGARNPISPQSPKARLAADAAKATDAGSPGSKASQGYRTRGLVTSDTPDPRRAAYPLPRPRPFLLWRTEPRQLSPAARPSARRAARRPNLCRGRGGRRRSGVGILHPGDGPCRFRKRPG